MPVKLSTPKNRKSLDPNMKNPKPFVHGSPEVWEAAYLQMANAGVPQDVITKVYHKLRATNDMFSVTPLGTLLLSRLKLADGPDENTPDSVIEWLSDAYGVIAGNTDFPHDPKLDTLEDNDPEKFYALGIAALFDSNVNVQHIKTGDMGQIKDAAEIAYNSTHGKVPFTSETVDVINGVLNGTDTATPQNLTPPKPKTVEAEGLPPVLSSDDSDIDFDSVVVRKQPKTTNKPAETTADSKPAAEPSEDTKSTRPEISEEPKEQAKNTAEPAVSPAAPTEKIPAQTPSSEKPVEPAPTPAEMPAQQQQSTEPVAPISEPAPAPEIPASTDKENGGTAEDITGIVTTDTPTQDASSGTEDSTKETPQEIASNDIPASSDDDVGEVVAGETEEPNEPEKEVANNSSEETAADAANSIGDVSSETPGSDRIATHPTKHVNIPQKVLMEIYAHAGTPEQVAEAARLVEQDITTNTPNAQFLVRYVPGVTQEIIKDILVNRTASGKYINRQVGKSGNTIPHTNLTGGVTYTSENRSRALGPVEVPSGFAQENSSVLWDEPVITSMGFPFVNFGAPEIYTILKDKDESKVKKAYKKLKKQLKKIGLDSPIKVLKDFKQAKGVRCALNRITVDAEEILGNGNVDVMASVYPRVDVGMRSSIGSVSLTRDFIVEMYKVLSPTKGAKVYMDTLGMSEDEYADTLNRDGRPPLYIFIPKERLAFSKAPAGFIARLFTSNNKPTLVEAKIGTHFGGFVMPFKTTRLLFTEV